MLRVPEPRAQTEKLPMARGDNRRTPKMKRRARQAKLKARIQRRIEAGKAAKK